MLTDKQFSLSIIHLFKLWTQSLTTIYILHIQTYAERQCGMRSFPMHGRSWESNPRPFNQCDLIWHPYWLGLHTHVCSLIYQYYGVGFVPLSINNLQVTINNWYYCILDISVVLYLDAFLLFQDCGYDDMLLNVWLIYTCMY